jgi:predicted AlkP superfamily phosphohydrolase/phosphomutase/Flp pilus assembly protein TadD
MSPLVHEYRMTAFRSVACAALLLLGAGPSCRSREVPGRVIVLGIDGLDPGVVETLAAEGRLPNLARLRETGAFGRLRSQPPLLSPVVWTTIATGQPMERHGIAHFTVTDPATGEHSPVTSDLRRVKALWNIASDRGLDVAVVGWWATWPPEEVRGSIVSDRTSYHFLLDPGRRVDPAVALTHPSGLAERIRPLVRRPDQVTAADLAPFLDAPLEPAAGPLRFDDDVAHFRWALAAAETQRRVALKLWEEDRPRLLMVYVEAVDTASHLFGHLFRASGLSGELAEQQRRFGRTVEETYRYADGLVGDLAAAADADTTLLVVSDHGFDLGRLPDDPSATRDMRRVSEAYHRLEGTILMHRRGVRPGPVAGATILDVAPTVLALLGLPAARDMPGKALRSALDVPALPEAIATYEDGSARRALAPRDRETDAEVLERLGALGYVDAGTATSGARRSVSGERNLAEADFQAGKFEAALAVYRRLVEERPEDASLRTDLAGALGALGRYGEAGEQLLEALALDPLNVEALYNRGVIHEKSGRRGEAVVDYRRAARYRPDYEPARNALVRLTGTADPRPPRGAEEARARGLAERAREAARRGDYAGAAKLLDQAEALAPRSVVVLQYRANVAWLMGDRTTAQRALRRALELEPDNELFRSNLARLQ